MYHNESVYFPDTEARNPLIPVTTGCKHGKCTFCTMYKGSTYSQVPLTDIEYELKNGSGIADKIFLTGADPLSVGFERMSAILKLVKKYYPYCARVSCYAAVRTIAGYTDEQLIELYNNGLNMLYIGFESGDDEVLKACRKGHTAAMAVAQAKRMNDIGIAFTTVVMYGLAGKGKCIDNAVKTAQMINQFKTHKIVTMNLTVFEGSELSRMIRDGEFTEPDGDERRAELKTLLELLEPAAPTVFDTTHATNTVKIKGILPEDKAKLISML